MKEYVLGLAFDEVGRNVALIKKVRGPPSVVGHWNGIGGKLNEGEGPDQAMVREFTEETGVKLPQEAWQFCLMLRSDDWIVYVYRCFTRYVWDVKTVTDEIVCVAHVQELQSVVPNLRWLIPLVLDWNAVMPMTIWERDGANQRKVHE